RGRRTGAATHRVGLRAVVRNPAGVGGSPPGDALPRGIAADDSAAPTEPGAGPGRRTGHTVGDHATLLLVRFGGIHPPDANASASASASPAAASQPSARP